MAYAGDALYVEDDAQSRHVAFSSVGRLRAAQGHPPGRVLAFHADSFDVELGFGTGREEIRRYPIGRGRSRALVAAGDAAFAALTRPDSAAPAIATRYVSPAVAVNDRELVVGNPYTYRFQAYDPAGRATYAFGRDLPPRVRTPAELAEDRTRLAKQRRSGIPGPKDQRIMVPGVEQAIARLPTAPLRHFSAVAGTQFDGAGRLWVIGDLGDSTFADVFADGRFLGRRILPCAAPSRFQSLASLNDRWLALLCRAPDEDETREVELQLYLNDEPVR